MNSIDNSMADAVVSIVNTDVYGKCKAYPVENIGASSFARWARETLNLLRAHPQLAKTKRIPLDSVAPEARNPRDGDNNLFNIGEESNTNIDARVCP